MKTFRFAQSAFLAILIIAGVTVTGHVQNAEAQPQGSSYTGPDGCTYVWNGYGYTKTN